MPRRWARSRTARPPSRCRCAISRARRSPHRSATGGDAEGAEDAEKRPSSVSSAPSASERGWRQPMSHAPFVTSGPLKPRYQVVVVGGGVNGLGVARHLALAGLTDVLVLERGYLLAGASGRNGGGIRAQWGTADNLVLARESIRMFRGMSAELGFNVFFRQGGYLFLAHD